MDKSGRSEAPSLQQFDCLHRVTPALFIPIEPCTLSTSGLTMPPNKAPVRTFWIAGKATYSDCHLYWNTSFNQFSVCHPSNLYSNIIQESFGTIQKVLHESVEPSCLTLVMNPRWDPEEKVHKSPRLIFLFRDVSSAINFHKVLLPLNKDYVKIIAKCSW